MKGKKITFVLDIGSLEFFFFFFRFDFLGEERPRGPAACGVRASCLLSPPANDEKEIIIKRAWWMKLNATRMKRNTLY